MDTKRDSVQTAYITPDVAMRIAQAYALQVRQPRESASDVGDDETPLYALCFLYNVGFQLWMNTSYNKSHATIVPLKFIHRTKYQRQATHGFPILNILYSAAGTYMDGCRMNIGHYNILTVNNNMFSYYDNNVVDLEPTTSFDGPFKWSPSKTIYDVHDDGDYEVQLARRTLMVSLGQERQWDKWWWIYQAKKKMRDFATSPIHHDLVTQLRDLVRGLEADHNKMPPRDYQFRLIRLPAGTKL